MTTPAQTTLLHAAELLEAEAKALNEFWNNKKNPPEWIGAPKARAIHDDALCTALELRLLARRRLWGITPELSGADKRPLE